MNEAKIPKKIKAEQYCQQGASLVGYLTDRDLIRLRDSVHIMNSELLVNLNFIYDEYSKPVARGTLNISLDLICQRCLKPFELNIHTDLNWVFVLNDKEAKQAQHHYDPVLLENNGELKLIDVLEDEIFLNLPIIPMHKNLADCKFVKLQSKQTDFEENDQVNYNPFSVLKTLKKDNKD